MSSSVYILKHNMYINILNTNPSIQKRVSTNLKRSISRLSNFRTPFFRETRDSPPSIVGCIFLTSCLYLRSRSYYFCSALDLLGLTYILTCNSFNDDAFEKIVVTMERFST